MVGAVTMGSDQALILITIITAAILAPIVIVTAFFALELLAGLQPLEQSRGIDGALVR